MIAPIARPPLKKKRNFNLPFNNRIANILIRFSNIKIPLTLSQKLHLQHDQWNRIIVDLLASSNKKVVCKFSDCLYLIHLEKCGYVPEINQLTCVQKTKGNKKKSRQQLFLSMQTARCSWARRIMLACNLPLWFRDERKRIRVPLTKSDHSEQNR